MCLTQQNNILNEKFKNLKSKDEILRRLKSEIKTHEEKHNNTHFYEEGIIDGLAWVLGKSNITIKEIEKELKEYV